MALRASRPQLRPVHQLCDSFLEVEGRGNMTVIVVGIGSPHGDDQLGWSAIDGLRRACPPASPRTRSGAGSSSWNAWRVRRRRSSSMPSRRPDGPGPSDRSSGPAPNWPFVPPPGPTTWGWLTALRMAETLDRLPDRVLIYTVEARQTDPGVAPSPDVASRLDAVLEAILRMSTSPADTDPGRLPARGVAGHFLHEGIGSPTTGVAASERLSRRTQR